MSTMLAEEPNATVEVSLIDESGNPLKPSTSTINVGEISENAPPIENYDYVRAQIKSDSGTNTEIKWLATYNGQVYYSAESTNVAGTILTANDEIQLVYRTHVEKFTVNYEVYVDGTKQDNYDSIISIDGPEEAEENTSFSFLLDPSNGYSIQSVYQDNHKLSGTNGEYQSEQVNANSTIRIDLNRKETANITFDGSNTCFSINNSGWMESDKSHTVSFDTTQKSLSFDLHVFKEYEPKDEAVLNKLTISIGDIKNAAINIPGDPNTSGNSAVTNLSDSLKVTVTHNERYTSVRTNNGSRTPTSYTYTVKIETTETGLFDDISIVTNFKEAASREIFIKQIIGVSPVRYSTNGGYTLENKILDPSTSDDSFVNEVRVGNTYKFYFNVLEGYIADIDYIDIAVSADGQSPGYLTKGEVQREDPQYGSYDFYFQIEITDRSQIDWRVFITATQANYKINYVGTTITDDSIYESNDLFRIPDEIPTRSGYVFENWSIGGTTYDPGDTISIANIDSSAITWDDNANVYTINVNPNWVEAEEAESVYYSINIYKNGTLSKTLTEKGVIGKKIQIIEDQLAAILAELQIDNTYQLTNESNTSIESLSTEDNTINLYYEQIKDASELQLTFTGKEEKYSGVEQTLEPATAIDGAKIEYSVNGTTWTSDLPKYKNAGTYPIQARATLDGYETATTTATLTITKRTVIVTAPSDEKIYDGTPLNTFYNTANYQAATITGDDFVTGEGFEYFVYTDESSITAPGSKKANVIDVDASPLLEGTDLNTNYDIIYENGELKILNRPADQKYIATITPDGLNTTYDGTEKVVNTFKSSFTDQNQQPLSGFRVEGVTFEAKGTNVGEYPVVQSGTVKIVDNFGNDVTEQFTCKVGQANLVINKRDITITAASEAFDYNGEDHSNSNSSVTAGSLVTGHRYTATVSGTVHNQGEIVANVISDIHIYDANNNEVTENYNITAVNGKLSVNKIDAQITATVTINTKSSDYTGFEQKFTELDGEDYTVEYSFDDSTQKIETEGWEIKGSTITTARTNAGESIVDFENRNNLYVVDKEGNKVESAVVNVISGTLTIKKVNLTITAASDEKEYDGKPLTNNLYTSEGLKGNDAISTIVIVGSQLAPGQSDNVIQEGSVQITNGTSTIATENYNIILKNGTLTVNNDDKESRKIVITPEDKYKVYDGNPLTSKAVFITGEGVTLNGDYINEYQDRIDRGNITTNGTQTYVGSSSNEVKEDSVHIYHGSVDVTEAYTIVTGTGKLEVSKRKITLISDDDSKVYDGKPLEKPEVNLTNAVLAETDKFEAEPKATGSVTNVTGSEGVPNTITRVKIIDKVTGEDRTNNYDIFYQEGKLIVTKAPASENAITMNDETVVYDSTLQHLETATGAVSGSTVEYRVQGNPNSQWSTTMPAFTEVGTYIIEARAINDNYETSYTTATLNINKRPVVITGSSRTTTYDGGVQSVSGYSVQKQDDENNVGLVTGQRVRGVTASASGTNANTYEGTITNPSEVRITNASGTIDYTNNYDISTDPGSITIEPKSVTIESDSSEKLYDNTPLANEKIKTEPKLAVGDHIQYSNWATQTEIGKTENTFTYQITDEDGEPINDNYDVTITKGTLTVYGQISYNANGGTGTAPEADRFDAGDTYTVKENMFERAGYTFGSWNTRPDGKGTQYAENAQITDLQNNVTLYAQWLADKDTKYKVETYLEGEDGNYPEDPNTSITRTATTDTKVSVTDADKQAPEGYALDPNADNVFDGTVAGDESLVLKLYFAKDVIGPDPENPGDEIPDKYQILFTYKAKENGVVTGETYELHTFTDEDGNYVKPTATTPDAKVEATADAGYHIDKWIDESSTELGNGIAPEFGDTTYTTNQTFTVSFAENDNVTINYEATKGGSVSLDSETVAPATGNPQGSTAKAEVGYTFDGWYLGDTKVGSDLAYKPSRNADGIYEAATYTAKFTPNDDTPYTVNIYLSDANGNYGDPATSDVRTATTDTKVSVTDADKQAPEGYALDPNANNVFEGTVAGDGSLILKVYFAKDEIGENPEDPGDNIPDKYQILFTYEAKENGVVTGETYELHTFTDEDGNYVKPEPTIPDAEVKATANAGYHINKWVDESSTELGNGTAPEFGDTTYTTNQTFTVSFAELESVTIHYEAKDGGSVTNTEDVINPEIGTPEGSKAVCNDGYEFDGWYLNDEKISSDLEFVPTKNAEGRYEEATYVAVFKKKEIPVDPEKKDDDTNTSTQTNMNAYMTMLLGSGLLGGLLLILRKKREQE